MLREPRKSIRRIRSVHSINHIPPAPEVTRAERKMTMFKKFIQRIIEAKDREDAIQNVFYGADGIDIAYQREKITWKEHEMLLALIEKMA